MLLTVLLTVLMTVLTLRSSARGCVVLLSVLIMLVFLDYVALNVLAVNVAFIVGLLKFTMLIAPLYFRCLFIVCIALWIVIILLFVVIGCVFCTDWSD